MQVNEAHSHDLRLQSYHKLNELKLTKLIFQTENANLLCCVLVNLITNFCVTRWCSQLWLTAHANQPNLDHMGCILYIFSQKVTCIHLEKRQVMLVCQRQKQMEILHTSLLLQAFHSWAKYMSDCL